MKLFEVTKEITGNNFSFCLIFQIQMDFELKIL
jgi:hypothetical protein